VSEQRPERKLKRSCYFTVSVSPSGKLNICNGIRNFGIVQLKYLMVWL